MGASITPTMDDICETPGCPAASDSLAGFASRLFRHLDRADQRRWGHLYLAALLSTPGKKSIRRLAGSVSASPDVAPSLRRFVGASTWDWHPVMDELAGWAAEHGKPRAWSIRTALLPKRGDRSVGVHRRFDPVSGRTVTCQLGIAAFRCLGSTHVPAAWQLALPKPWAEDAELRERTRIPDAAGYQPLWKQVLAMVDRLATTAAAEPVVIELGDDPSAEPLIRELVRRRREFVVAVPPHLATAPTQPVPAGTPLGVCGTSDLVLDASWRAGRPVHIASAPVRLPGVNTEEPGGARLRLLAERLPDGRAGRNWITSIPRHRMGSAASLALLGGQTAGVVAEMADGFGLLDFEGRSFPGWHHHTTLVSAAYAYRRLADARPTVPGPRAAPGGPAHQTRSMRAHVSTPGASEA